MSVYYQREGITLYCGDALAVLATLPAGSVQTCITSPPYLGLRDYGTAQWDGGDTACDHVEMSVGMSEKNTLGPTGYLPSSNAANIGRVRQYRDLCGKCGARRIDQQIGLEDTPAAYVAALVAVFREVRRVLRDDGTLWLNLGDAYANDAKWGGATGGKHADGLHGATGIGRQKVSTGYPPKCLMGLPWRVAFALIDDGWILRSDIVWHKPNPMPESVTDRPTRSHEYIFLLTKSARYWYDADAIREPHATAETDPRRRVSLDEYEAAKVGRYVRSGADELTKGRLVEKKEGFQYLGHPLGRNRRTVWSVASQPTPFAHFATFPPALIEPCILAGTSERGHCPTCGTPWRRVVKRGEAGQRNTLRGGDGQQVHRPGASHTLTPIERETLGWEPSCACPEYRPVPDVVLDPFAGSGTTGKVAHQHGRHFVGIELNPDYCRLAVDRLAQVALPFGEAAGD